MVGAGLRHPVVKFNVTAGYLLMSFHHGRKEEGNLWEGYGKNKEYPCGNTKRYGASEYGSHGNAPRLDHSGDDKEVHTYRGGEVCEFDLDHHKDAEPQEINMVGDKHREENRKCQQHHGQGIHGNAQYKIDDHDDDYQPER
jgi:hypothetical protein